MAEAGSKAKEGGRTASRRLKGALGRPVTARLAEPLGWASGLAIGLAGLPPEGAATTLRAAALFLVARLVVDTAPNLHAAARMEREPYDQRPLRRALGRVKLTVALGCAVVAWLVLHGTPDLSRAAGGTTNGWVLLLAVLSTYVVVTPVLREHRGLPIARPNLGPTAGALLFALTGVLAPPPTAPALLVRGAACVVLGNLLFGLGQRYRAAARRIDRPLDSWSLADPRTRDLVLPRAEHDLVRSALATWPLLLLPVWPPVCAAFAGRFADPRALLAAALVGALPAILFDVTRPGLRTTAAAVAAAALLGALASLAAPPDDRTLLAAAATALVLPGGSALLARGHARALITAATAVVLARAFSTVAPQSLSSPLEWPVPELCGAIAVSFAALVAGRGRRA